MTQPNVEWPNLNVPFDPNVASVVDASKVEPQVIDGDPADADPEHVTLFAEDDDPQSNVGDEVEDNDTPEESA